MAELDKLKWFAIDELKKKEADLTVELEGGKKEDREEREKFSTEHEKYKSEMKKLAKAIKYAEDLRHERLRRPRRALGKRYHPG